MKMCPTCGGHGRLRPSQKPCGDCGASGIVANDCQGDDTPSPDDAITPPGD